MEIVCVLMHVAPEKIRGGDADYWKPAQKLLNDPNLLGKLAEYDAWSLPGKALQQATQRLKQLNTTKEEVCAKSFAAASIYGWAEAVVTIGQFDPTVYGGSKPEPHHDVKKSEQSKKFVPKGQNMKPLARQVELLNVQPNKRSLLTEKLLKETLNEEGLEQLEQLSENKTLADNKIRGLDRY